METYDGKCSVCKLFEQNTFEIYEFSLQLLQFLSEAKGKYEKNQEKADQNSVVLQKSSERILTRNPIKYQDKK